MKKISKLRGMQDTDPIETSKLILWKTSLMKFPKVMVIKR